MGQAFITNRVNKVTETIEVGSNMKATLLWTNPSPTASFVAQNITLNDSMLNYDYIMFEVLIHNTLDYISQAIYTRDTFYKYVPSNTTAVTTIGDCYNGSTHYVRMATRLQTDDDFTLRINAATRLGGTGTLTDRVIPIKIYGVKGTIDGI